MPVTPTVSAVTVVTGGFAVDGLVDVLVDIDEESAVVFTEETVVFTVVLDVVLGLVFAVVFADVFLDENVAVVRVILVAAVVWHV